MITREVFLKLCREEVRSAIAQHADEDGNEADRLANDRADGYVVNIVDQPCGRGDQAELAGAAGIL